MIPEPDDMIQFARLLEEDIHKLGWDHSPVLGVVIQLAPGLDSRSVGMTRGYGRFAMTLFPVQPADLPGPPGEVLSRIGSACQAGRLKPTLPEEIGSLCGVALVVEAWSNNTPPDERDGRSLADIPGSKEVRNVTVIDCGGRVYFLERVRGKQPTIEQWPDPAMFTGRIPDALRDILLAFASAEPDGQVDLAALQRVGTYEPQP